MEVGFLFGRKRLRRFDYHLIVRFLPESCLQNHMTLHPTRILQGERPLRPQPRGGKATIPYGSGLGGRWVPTH